MSHTARTRIAAVSVLLAIALGAALLPRFGAGLAGPAPAPPALATMELGQGPTLVFLPDLGLWRTAWMPTARELLAGGRRIVLADLPGHGESPMPDPFSIEACAAELDAVLARHNGDSTIVIGQGMGGLIAAVEIANHPERARGLVLVDAAFRTPLTIPDQQRAAFFKWMDDNYDVFVRQLYAQRGRDSTQGAEIVAQASLVPASTMKRWFHELVTLDRAGALKNFPRPVMYVGSSRSWPADKDWSTIATERGLAALHAPRILRLGRSGALIAKDQPDSLAAAIASFASQAMAGPMMGGQ